VVVDTVGQFTNGVPVDTLVQISNTASNNLKQAHCFWLNANSHCADNPAAVCQGPQDCPSGGGFAPCVAGWNEIDFNIFLTQDQPLGWYASEGLQRGDFALEGPGVCDFPPGKICVSDAQCAGSCMLGQSNIGSGIPPVPEDPFIGSLKCVEYDPSNPPVPDQTATTNTLKGEGSLVAVAISGVIDVRKYNAVGLRATGTGDTDNVLTLGGPDAEYDSCAQTLVFDHMFDHATDPISVGGICAGGSNAQSPCVDDVDCPGSTCDDSGSSDSGMVTTELTLVPCGDNLLTREPGAVTAQFLVFNEFEQRFSTSRAIDAFYSSGISTIDTANPNRSIFSAGVSGTIAGQTRIRGVGDAATGRGLIGVAEMALETSDPDARSGVAYNINQQGNSATADVITLP
jgi:hypothetical protein